MKRGRPKKIIPEIKKPPACADRITFSLKLAGYDRLVDIDNVLDFFRTLDKAPPIGIDPLKVKSRATFEITYKSNTYRKVLNITQFKRLLFNDVYRQITAKLCNRALGINVDNYK